VIELMKVPSPVCYRLVDRSGTFPFRVEMQLHDHGEGQGTLTIRHDGQAWTHYWSHMGCQLRDFLADSSDCYVVRKLAPGISEALIDWDAGRVLLKQLLEARANDPADRYTFCELAAHLRDLVLTDDQQMPGQHHLLSTAFQSDDYEDWGLPEVPDPEYQRLERCVRMCIEACKQLQQEQS
jgi:hypothetical protein